MKCKICGENNQICFNATILKKYKINYFQCKICQFVQTENPYWLSEAYTESINISDTGYMVRNLNYWKRVKPILYILFKNKGKYIDYASGYGVFVRLMRDSGFDFYWSDKYTKNILALGFDSQNVTEKVNAVTLFEVFEHFENPILEIENLLTLSNNIIFSTETYPNPLPKPEDWWYYGLEHGQHISIYSKDTFKYISNKFDLYYYNFGSLHILSKNIMPFWKLWFLKFGKYFNFFYNFYISKHMTSKTWEDHLKLSKV